METMAKKDVLRCLILLFASTGTLHNLKKENDLGNLGRMDKKFSYTQAFGWPVEYSPMCHFFQDTKQIQSDYDPLKVLRKKKIPNSYNPEAYSENLESIKNGLPNRMLARSRNEINGSDVDCCGSEIILPSKLSNRLVSSRGNVLYMTGAVSADKLMESDMYLEDDLSAKTEDVPALKDLVTLNATSIAVPANTKLEGSFINTNTPVSNTFELHGSVSSLPSSSYNNQDTSSMTSTPVMSMSDSTRYSYSSTGSTADEEGTNNSPVMSGDAYSASSSATSSGDSVSVYNTSPVLNYTVTSSNSFLNSSDGYS